MVKRCIKYSHMNGLGQQLPAGKVTFEILGIMQGRKIMTDPNPQQGRIVNHDGLMKVLSSVYHAVAHAMDLFWIFQDALSHHPFKCCVECRAMVPRVHLLGFGRIRRDASFE